MVKQIIEASFKRKTFYILLSFLIIGIIIFVSRDTNTNFYLSVSSILCNPLFLCIFVFPFVIIEYLFIYQNISNLTPILTRMTKKQYIKFITKISFIYTAYIFVIIILLIFIGINMLHDVDYTIEIVRGIYKLGNHYNILVLLFNMMRIIATIFTYVTIVNLILLTNKNKVSVFCIILIDILIFVSKSISFKSFIINFLLPSNHIYDYVYTVNTYINLFATFIYFLSINISLYKLLNYYVQKKDIIEVDIC